MQLVALLADLVKQLQLGFEGYLFDDALLLFSHKRRPLFVQSLDQCGYLLGDESLVPISLQIGVEFVVDRVDLEGDGRC